MSVRFFFLFIALCFVVPVAQAQGITVTPGELNFGNVAVGSIVGLEFTLENTDDRSQPSVMIFPADTAHFNLGWTGERAEATRVMDGIRGIYKAILMFLQDFGEDPSSVDELIESNYLEIPDSVLMNWNFTLIGQNPVTQIEAVSTDEMPGGGEQVILFDIETGRFNEEGYGVPIGDPQIPLRVMETINSIHNAALLYRQDNREDPSSVDELEEMEYLVIPHYMNRKWHFTLIGSNPITQIEAVSTAEMRGGGGHVILFDIQTNQFSGYRIPYREFFDLLWGGEQEHGTLTLSVSFQPDEEREYSSEILIEVSGLEGDPDTLRITVSGNGVLSVSEPSEIPSEFSLFPAYPNPFNSTTTIEYALPYASEVSLNLYKLTGQRIETLVNGRLQAGVHRVMLDAGDLASGLYFVKLNANSQAISRKLLLVK